MAFAPLTEADLTNLHQLAAKRLQLHKVSANVIHTYSTDFMLKLKSLVTKGAIGMLYLVDPELIALGL